MAELLPPAKGGSSSASLGCIKPRRDEEHRKCIRLAKQDFIKGTERLVPAIFPYNIEIRGVQARTEQRELWLLSVQEEEAVVLICETLAIGARRTHPVTLSQQRGATRFLNRNPTLLTPFG